MHPHLRQRSALFGLGILALVVSLAGCGQSVREDRSINWSKEGGSLGFQHGEEGVFLADKDGGKLIRIFQPDSSVIATSSPLWSPAGKRVLFTTARRASGQQPVSFPFANGEQDPAGKRHFQQDIVYTCWFCEQPDGGKPAEPVALFEAAADHPGYVAANLAVRWHPRLDKVYFIKQVAEHQHGLFEYDLALKQSRQVFPHTSAALLFDWTPDGSRLVCVLGSTQKKSHDGIWIGQPDQDDWWHVPHSRKLAAGESGSLLENLRATKPAWTSDGQRFAFPTCSPASKPEQPDRHFVRQATLATRTVEVWVEGDQPFRDLVWDRAGLRLGVVRSGKIPSLHLVRQGQPLLPAINRTPVRRFAGWSSEDKQLAYIVADEPALGAEEPWALLLLPDELARDKVYLAAGDGTEAGRPVFSGMRVTFPQWSPNENKLSLWVTFMPTHRSVISHLLGWGLRPGDPAAVLDLKTEQVAWMPVNAQEKVQVGHYYLLKRDYQQACRWYQEAEQELPPPAPVTVRDFQASLRTIQGPRDFSFFQYYCLTKLDRVEEAQAKLEQFRRHFLPRFVDPAPAQEPPAAEAADAQTPEHRLLALLDPSSLLGSLVQDLYLAEVFLSLDAAPDGEAFFRKLHDQADTDVARLSRAIVLGQILLLQKKHREYADLTTTTVAPLLTRMLKPVPASEPRDFLDAGTLAEFAGACALLPLGTSEFLSHLPGKQIEDMRMRWEKLQAEAHDGLRPVHDLVLQGLYQALGQVKESQEVAARLQNRPAGSNGLPVEKDAATTIAALRTMLHFLLEVK